MFIIYTEKFGKLEILGKAIRKVSSKLRSAAEIFYLSEIEFIQGKTYKTLTDAILIDKFEDLRRNLIRLNVASKISEVFDDLVQGQEPDEKIWNLLIESFERLNDWKNENSLEIIYYYFFWNFLSLLGYKPEFRHCSLCQEKLIPQNIYFNFKEGGLICQNCFKKVKSGKEITPETIKLLRIVLKKDWPTLTKLKIEKSHLKSLNEVSKECYSVIHNI